MRKEAEGNAGVSMQKAPLLVGETPALVGMGEHQDPVGAALRIKTRVSS